MRLSRVHRRHIEAPAERVGRLIDGLASDEDRLWPRDRWPTLAIQLDRPLAVGAVGGHGPIRYAVDRYTPCERVVYRFTPGSGLEGTHSLEVEPLGDTRCRLTHAVDARLGARFAVVFPVFRAMHDAVVEDLLDRGELAATGRLAQPAHAPGYLRFISAVDVRTGGRAFGWLGHLSWPRLMLPATHAAACPRRHRARGWPRHLAGALSPMALTASRVALEQQRSLRTQRLADAARDRLRQRVRPTRARMRALSVSPGARFYWREVPVPTGPGPDAAIVHPIAVATCDLDRALALGATPFLLPLHFGHECVADVVSVGERVRTVRAGDRVIVPFQISCGRCRRCRAGLTANCQSVPPISMYGFGIGGGHWGGAVSDQLAVRTRTRCSCRCPMGSSPPPLQASRTTSAMPTAISTRTSCRCSRATPRARS
jgi:Alcohol dehydrogenase GroES-like domain